MRSLGRVDPRQLKTTDRCVQRCIVRTGSDTAGNYFSHPGAKVWICVRSLGRHVLQQGFEASTTHKAVCSTSFPMVIIFETKCRTMWCRPRCTDCGTRMEESQAANHVTSTTCGGYSKWWKQPRVERVVNGHTSPEFLPSPYSLSLCPVEAVVVYYLVVLRGQIWRGFVSFPQRTSLWAVLQDLDTCSLYIVHCRTAM